MKIIAKICQSNKKGGTIMRKEEFERIKENIMSGVKRFPEVKAVYLFGSYATGKQKPISDIDICVIAEKTIGKSKKLQILAYAGKNTDIVMFHDLPISVKANVLKEGMPLFCRDDEFLADITVATMKEYLDFSHVLKRFTKLYMGG